MRMRRPKKNALAELQLREIGVPSPWWTSIRTLRHTLLGPRRYWKLILKFKETSLLELSEDLLWITKPSNGEKSIMQRISADGKRMHLFKVNVHPRPKEVQIYDIPDPAYKSSIPQHDYRPFICALRKGNVFTRHDLYTGEMYDQIHLGNWQSQSLNPCLMQDMILVKSAKLKFEYRKECFFHFDAFQMHPFALVASFNIDGLVFPAEEHKRLYGKLRSAEIHDGMLLIMTEKNYSLIYNAQEIIESKRRTATSGSSDLEQPSHLVTEPPPLLFATYAHMDILALGGCPWAYIHAVSDYMLEVRDLQTFELLEGGRVTWRDSNDQKISPDYLMFFPDDSNRLIHVKTSELRVLSIQEVDGNRKLVEVFRYPEKKNIPAVETIKYSRSGRLIKSKYEFDESLNRALAFDVETDVKILVILEAKRDIEHNCTYLIKATFYDSLTYAYLYEFKISARVEGDIETHRLSVHIDRDIINIVSEKGVCHTVFSFRLREARKTLNPKSRKAECNDDDDDIKNESDVAESDSDDEYQTRQVAEIQRRRRSTNRQKQRRSNRQVRNRRSSQVHESSEESSP